MKIALYHPWIYLRSGVERMLYELVHRSAHDWVLFTHHYEPVATYPELNTLDVVELTPSVSVRRTGPKVGGAAAVIARTRLPDVGARILLVSSESFGDLVLLRNHLPAVCYCHTPLKILHDPTTRARLNERGTWNPAAATLAGPLFDSVTRRMWTRYDHAFANSEEVRTRLERARFRPGGGGRVEVLHPGVDLDRLAFTLDSGRGHGRPRFVVAGRIMWQKRIESAIDAIRIMTQAGLEAELVVAGAVDHKSRGYLERLRSLAMGLPVGFEPNVTDDRMRTLLADARAMVCAAPNEDFGMVVLEALACGTPVIAVDRGGPREILTHGVDGWLVDGTPEAIAARMTDAATMESGRLTSMRVAARHRAEQFSWEPFVRRVDEVLDMVASGARSKAPPR